MLKTTNDRNFDALADHFEKKIYGSIKGALRQKVISRDLFDHFPNLKECSNQSPLNILDSGGGLGYFSIELAKRGHQVHYNDLSQVMTNKAQDKAKQAGVLKTITWSTGPCQDIQKGQRNAYDIVLCHAVLEWLSDPKALIPILSEYLKPNGSLSLCYYNASSIIYRNLIRGNFNWVKSKDSYCADENSLTPNSPHERNEVNRWLDNAGFLIQSETGIRVFSDYVIQKKGGNCIEEEVIAMELNYSKQEPYKYMGRYLHCIAHKAN